jgi:small subunit ribosomal protein S20
MPNSASAKKRLRQSLDRRARNRVARTTLRTQIKKCRATIAGGDAAVCETEFRTTVKKLDQAAANNILHANAAARLKSRLSKAIKAVKAKAAS